MAKPKTGKTEKKYKNPCPTVDIIIEASSGAGRGIVLIDRKNPPYGWALPGGFVDYSESLEAAAIREAKEETSLDARLVCQMHVYSDPDRDPRFHTIATVFVAEAEGRLQAGDDARDARVFAEKELPPNLAFDHERIIRDYFRWKKKGFKVFEIKGDGKNA